MTEKKMTEEQFEALTFLFGGTPGSAAHEALRLWALEGYTQKAAAEKAGLSFQAVGRKVERARELIQAAQPLYGLTLPEKRPYRKSDN